MAMEVQSGSKGFNRPKLRTSAPTLSAEPKSQLMTVDYMNLVRITQALEDALQSQRQPHVKRIERLVK